MNMKKENYFVTARRVAIQDLRALIVKKGKWEYRKIMAYMQMLGFREKTVKEYIEVLENAGFIRYDGESKAYVAVQAEA